MSDFNHDGFEFDYRERELFILISFFVRQNAALSSAIQHTMSRIMGEISEQIISILVPRKSQM